MPQPAGTSCGCDDRPRHVASLAAAARYDGRIGVPAILPRRLWTAIEQLGGDQGARALLRDAPSLTLVEMPGAALDIDTPADLLALRNGTRGSATAAASALTQPVAPLA